VTLLIEKSDFPPFSANLEPVRKNIST